MADASTLNLSFWENFVESIALVLSRGLTDDETEKFVSSWSNFQNRLRELSFENLKKLQVESKYVRPHCKHKNSCTLNAIRGFIKTFITVYSVKYGLGFFPALITGRIFKKPELIWKIGGKDTLSFSVFMSSFTTMFKAALCSLRRVRNQNDWKNSFLAGVAAGTTIFLDNNKTRRVMIALYLSTRSCHFMSRYLWRHYLEPQWDPHARAREALSKEKKEKSVSNPTLRDFGKLRSEDTSARKSILLELSDEYEPSSAGSDSFASIDDDLKIIELSPVKAARISFIRKFIRQSAAVAVMMLSSSQILNVYIMNPDTLARSYLSFLIVHGGIKSRSPPQMSKQLLQTIGMAAKAGSETGISTFIAPPLDANTPLNFEDTLPTGYPKKEILKFSEYMSAKPHKHIVCALQHNFDQSCISGNWKLFKDEWWRALSLYAPLNFVMSMLFKGKMIYLYPVKYFRHVTLSILRSTLFLSCYCTVAWLFPCTLRNLFRKEQNWHYYVNGLLSGAMVLLEAPGRRLELALYCVPRAIESFWNVGVLNKWWKDIPGGEGIYFSICMGIIMTLYQHDPESIQDGYRKVMVRFLGVN